MANTQFNKVLEELRQFAREASISEETMAELAIAIRNVSNSAGDIAKVTQALEQLRIIAEAVRIEMLYTSKLDLSSLANQVKKLENLYKQIANMAKSSKSGAIPTAEGKEGFGEYEAGAKRAIELTRILGRTLESEFVAGSKATQNLTKVLASYGFELQNVVRATKDESTGITRVNVAASEGEGVIRTLSLTVDRLGRVATQSSVRFKNLAQQVARNTLEFAKWTIAMSLVYQPLRLLGEGIQTVIDNQTELANIAIVLGDSQEKLGVVFDSVAEAANLTGESINGVLQGYSQAIRAAGGAASEVERLVQANQILEDSLILSKLSTLNQAKAMDILVAATRQAGLELTEGRQLLDVWVATTKVANVDLQTLAESYAIVGTTAKSAGLDIAGANNELVGLIAVLAEQTQLTPTQTGNALRAVISGLNTDVAIRELRNFGVAVTDAEGNLRGFMDVMEQIAQLYKQGLISDAEISKIARAIGGGTRRQIQVEIVLKNLARAQQINAATANATGDAYEALQTQTQTLSTALTRLGNAFIELAQTLGTEGGIINAATTVVNLFEKIVSLADSVAGAFGEVTPALLVIGALGAYGFASGSSPFKSLSGGIDRALIGGGLIQPTTRYTAGGAVASAPSTRFLGGASPGELAVAAAGVALTSVLPAMRNRAEGNNTAAVADLLGGAIGAAIAVTLTGQPQWAIVGAAIGSGFLESIVNGITQIEGDVGLAIYERRAGKEAPASEKEKEKTTPVDQQVLKAIGIALGATEENAINRGGAEVQRAYNLASGKLPPYVPKTLYGEDITGMAEKDIAALVLEHVDPATFEKMYQEQRRGKLLAGEIQTPFGALVDVVKEQQQQNLSALQTRLYAQLQSDVVGGQVGGRAANQRREAIGGVDAVMAQFIAAQGNQGIQIGGQMRGVAETIDIVGEAYVNATDDEQEFFGQLTSHISDLEDLKNEIKEGATDWTDYGTSAVDAQKNIQDQINLSRKILQQFTNEIIRNQEFANFQTPTIINAGAANFSDPALYQQFLNIAQRLEQKQEYGLYGNNQGLIDTYRQNLPQLSLKYDYFNYKPVGATISPEVARETLKYMEDVGIIGAGSFQNPSFFEMPFARGSVQDKQVQAAYRTLVGQLEERNLYKEDATNQLVIYANDQIELQKWDATIMHMLLRQIEENTSDMVDGIYNLPTNGTFYVPLQGAQLRPQAGAGGINLNEIIQAFQLFGQNGVTYEGGQNIEELMMRTNTQEPGTPAYQTKKYASQMGLEDLIKTPQDIETLGSFIDRVANSTQVKEVPSVRLELLIRANFETNLDGNLVSTVVKESIVDDLIKYEGAQGGAAKHKNVVM